MIAFVGLVSACQKDNDNGGNGDLEPAKRIELTKAGQELVSVGNNFSFGLFTTLYGESDAAAMLISPLGVISDFSMVANGAVGETRRQILNTLGYGTDDLAEVNSMYASLLSGILEADKSAVLENANSVWIANDFKINDFFVSLLGKQYSADAYNVNFHDRPETVEKINAWGSEKTHGMVPRIIEDLSPRTVLAFVNALYFKGKWSNKFDKSKTKTAKFLMPDGLAADKKFMNGDFSLRYAYDAGSKAALCSIPYGNGAFSMDVILPDTGVDFENFVEGLDYARFQTLQLQATACDVGLSLPKFECSYSTGESALVKTLRSLGMRLPFETEADFSGISDMGIAIAITEVMQKCAIKLDEDGTSAAAETIVNMGYTSTLPSKPVKVSFTADRPFVYVMKESSTGAILFIGTYAGE